MIGKIKNTLFSAQKIIKESFLLVKTAVPTANFLAALALILLTVKVLIFNNISGLFPQAYQIGLIFEAILTSIIASYIFYIIVVHTKEVSDKQTLQPYITRHTRSIVESCELLLDEISSNSNIKLNFNSISLKDISECFKVIDPKSKTQELVQTGYRTYVQADWIKRFQNNQLRT